MLTIQSLTFHERRHGNTPLEELNDWLAVKREPHPVSVQQIKEIFNTEGLRSITYLVTLSS